MISFFRHDGKIYALESSAALTNDDIQKLTWRLGGASRIREERLQGSFVGPRKEMITPWSTNAVEIARNMGIDSLQRMEVFVQAASETPAYDPMLSTHYRQLDQQLFSINRTPEAIKTIRDIATYNTTEGLALSDEEVEYLHQLSNRLGRPLTDSEVYGFAQVNSEHCRHKIFNGTFIIDGKEMPESLFSLIRKTSAVNPNKIVSAYKDNVAFVRGPAITQFAPARQDTAACFELSDRQSVIS